MVSGFAEALAGIRLGSAGNVELVTGDELTKLFREIWARNQNTFTNGWRKGRCFAGSLNLKVGRGCPQRAGVTR
jgi:hypothetical protein